jgi:23S rRNA pseudouridine2605 synthase
MKQNEIDALSQEVGLESIALPTMSTSERDKAKRLARKPSMYQARTVRRTKVPHGRK